MRAYPLRQSAAPFIINIVILTVNDTLSVKGWMMYMVKQSATMPDEFRPRMRDGEGTVQLTSVFSPDEYRSNTRLISHITLPAGASIGYHIHEQEEEFFYVLAGEAEFNDNGTIVRIRAGDATVTRGGEGHSVHNDGNVPFEMLAVIVTYPQV